MLSHNTVQDTTKARVWIRETKTEVGHYDIGFLDYLFSPQIPWDDTCVLPNRAVAMSELMEDAFPSHKHGTHQAAKGDCRSQLSFSD